MMQQDEMCIEVCGKMPELFDVIEYPTEGWDVIQWKDNGKWVNWPTEGLQVCHLAEKQIQGRENWSDYVKVLAKVCGWDSMIHSHLTMANIVICATYEQRLESLCKVWWPEKWKD